MTMSDLSLKLTAFEGPLDLLMHLIEKDKIDIYDIPIVSVTEQYINYLDQLHEYDMDLASEFLVMAATLLQIKSRMLLPKSADGDEDEEHDPRQQLVEMLVEYRRIKKAAAELLTFKEAADKCFQHKAMFEGVCERLLPDYSVGELIAALLSAPVYDNPGEAAYIEPQAFSVQEKMADIMQCLQEKRTGFSLSEFVSSGRPGEKVAVFLGVLELLKMGLVTITQSARFAPIYIFAKQGDNDAL